MKLDTSAYVKTFGRQPEGDDLGCWHFMPVKSGYVPIYAFNRTYAQAIEFFEADPRSRPADTGYELHYSPLKAGRVKVF